MNRYDILEALPVWAENISTAGLHRVFNLVQYITRKEHQARRVDAQPLTTTRQMIDRLLDHLDEKNQDDVYWHINKLLRM